MTKLQAIATAKTFRKEADELLQRIQAMTKLQAIATAKTFRKEADELLQRMKAHKDALMEHKEKADLGDEFSEMIAHHILSFRHVEDAIMRQGMVLKYIGNPDPYPESRNPASPVVAPTADGLRL